MSRTVLWTRADFKDPVSVEVWTFRTKIIALFPQQPGSRGSRQVGSLQRIEISMAQSLTELEHVYLKNNYS